MATKPHIEQMSKQERQSRVVPAQISERTARREAVADAGKRVKARASIDFVRSVRGE